MLGVISCLTPPVKWSLCKRISTCRWCCCADFLAAMVFPPRTSRNLKNCPVGETMISDLLENVIFANFFHDYHSNKWKHTQDPLNHEIYLKFSDKGTSSCAISCNIVFPTGRSFRMQSGKTFGRKHLNLETFIMCTAQTFTKHMIMHILMR